MTFISIHAPRMGSDLPAKPASRSMSISIHAPRMGSDLPSMVGEPCPVRFQSTLPGWGATGLRRRWGRPDQISIHAPRMGSDEAGARMAAACMEFQSTLPGWGATWQCRYGPAPHSIFQSTLPGWGATCRQCDIRRRSSDFNPRSPDGERLICDIIKGSVSRISIHAPRMGSDRENGHLRPRYGQNHPFSTLIVSQIVVDVLGTVRKSQKHQRTSHYEVIKQPERQK